MTKYIVHKDALCEASPVFQSAFNMKFRRSQDQHLDLPEVDAEIFESFVGWLYERKIFLQGKIEKLSGPKDKHILRVFAFGEKYNIQALKNEIISQLHAIMAHGQNDAIGTDTIRYVCKEVGEESGLRRLLIDWLTWRTPSAFYQKLDMTRIVKAYPAFGVDLIMAFSHKDDKPRRDPFTAKNLSTYLDKF